MQLLLLVLMIFFISFFCGRRKNGAKRFSVKWFVLLHIPIACAIILRNYLNFDWHYIPLTFIAVLTGLKSGDMYEEKKK